MEHQHNTVEHKHYTRLIIMGTLSFIAMYILMYAMVNRFSDVFPHINQFYMAGLMAAPMIIIEVIVMKGMYMDKKKNGMIITLSTAAMILFFLGIRQQSGVNDVQFLKSMIPHHSGAILMCREANIQDPEIKELCRTIIEGQQTEIDQMNAILARKK